MTYIPVDHEHDPLLLDPITRDRWGRPLLIPEGGIEADRTAYTRASTLASTICPDYGLRTWQQRRLAKGLSDRPDLAAMGSALPVLTGDRKTDAPTNRELDFIINEALMEGGAYVDAHYGTTIHGHTNPPGGVPLGPVPTYMATDVTSFHAKLAEKGLRIVDTELFTACDRLMSAGTFDHTVVDPNGELRVLEKKTGDLHMFEFLVQVTVYAMGQRYFPETDQRADLGVNTDYAWLAHIPRGQGRTDLYKLDLAKGRRLALMAKEIREEQRTDCSGAWELIE